MSTPRIKKSTNLASWTKFLSQWIEPASDKEKKEAEKELLKILINYTGTTPLPLHFVKSDGEKIPIKHYAEREAGKDSEIYRLLEQCGLTFGDKKPQEIERVMKQSTQFKCAEYIYSYAEAKNLRHILGNQAASIIAVSPENVRKKLSEAKISEEQVSPEMINKWKTSMSVAELLNEIRKTVDLYPSPLKMRDLLH